MMISHHVKSLTIVLSIISINAHAEQSGQVASDEGNRKRYYLYHVSRKWPDYDRHYNEASMARANRDCARALEQQKAAYAIIPIEENLYNIARDYHCLGRLTEAINYYERFIELSKTSSVIIDNEAVSRAVFWKQKALSELPLPIYKRKWFVPAIGGIVATGVSIAVGIVATQPTPTEQAVFRQVALRF